MKRCCLLLLMMICAFSALLMGQEDAGSILGHVTDNSGSIIVGAAIRVVHEETGVEAKTVSNDAGNFLIVSLPPGTYKLYADHPGFKHVEVPGIVLSIQHKARVDLAFEVGAVQETVSVTAVAASLVTDDTTVA